MGRAATADDYDRIVIASERGASFVFVKGAISAIDSALAFAAWGDIDEHEPPSTTRRQAAGALDLERFRAWRPDVVRLHPVSPTSARIELADGRVLRQVFSNPVRSYVGGFTVARFGNTAGAARLTSHHPERWAASIPFFRAVDDALSEAASVEHAAMAARAATHPTWTIPGTVLSTVAVNINYESRYHRDVGDFRDGMSTLTIVGDDYDGGLLVLPRLRLAFDVRPGDLFAFRAHEEIHGNTPITGSGKRVSFVTYLKHGLATALNAIP